MILDITKLSYFCRHPNYFVSIWTNEYKKDSFCKRAPTMKLQKHRKSTDKWVPSSFLRNFGKKKKKKKNKIPEFGQLTAVFLRSWPPLGQIRVLLRFYVTVSCEILTSSQHQNLFKPYKNMVNKRSSVLVKVRESTTIEWIIFRRIILYHYRPKNSIHNTYWKRSIIKYLVKNNL